MNKRLQPAMGTDKIRANRAADRCRSLFASTQKEEQVGGAAGRTRTILETARASSKPCTGKLWSRKSEKEASEFGSAALRPLHARSPLLLRPPPFIAQKGAVRHSIPYLPNLPASIPPRYLIRPYALLGAHVREEPVPTPRCSNSSLGRFSSRQRVLGFFSLQPSSRYGLENDRPESRL